MRISSIILSASVGLSSAASIDKRAVINHDAVVGFPETEAAGSIYLKFKPFLYRVNGCVPYPAVDAEGNTSGGLNPTGGSSSDCTSSTGQVYARASTARNCIMYSWFWPKDSPFTALGHRFDWENTIVCLSSLGSDAQIVGVSASAHGKYDKTTTPNLSGTRPLIRYYSAGVTNHQLGFTDVKGDEQPLVVWESLPAAARAALENTDFGAATVPFKDATFENNMANGAL